MDIWLVLDGTTFIRHFVTKTHSFRDEIASGQRSKIPSRTSIMANYIHLKDLGFSKEKAETRNEKLIST